MPWKGITLHVFGIGSVITVPTASEEALLEAQLLVTHLQGTAETDKASLARILHDDLGALMVSALMDLGAIQQLRADLGDPARLRLERAKMSRQFRRFDFYQVRLHIFNNLVANRRREQLHDGGMN